MKVTDSSVLGSGYLDLKPPLSHLAALAGSSYHAPIGSSYRPLEKVQSPTYDTRPDATCLEPFKPRPGNIFATPKGPEKQTQSP